MKNYGNAGKKILSLVLTLAMVMGMMTITEPSPANASGSKQIVYSQDFENGGVLSPLSGATPTASNKMDSDSNHYMEATHGMGGYKTDGIRVLQGQTYTFTYRIKVTSVTEATGEANPGVYMRSFYQEYYHIKSTESGYASNYGFATSDSVVKAVTDDWVTVSLSYTPSAGKNYVMFYIDNAHSGSVTYQLDDIELSYHPNEKNQIVNGEFDSITGWYDTSSADPYSAVSEQGSTPIYENAYVYNNDFSDGRTLQINSPGTQGEIVKDGDNDVFKITNTPKANRAYVLGVKVEAGKTYTISYRVKKVTEAPQLTAMLITQVYHSTNGGWLTGPEGVKYVRDNDWNTVEVTYTIPEGKDTMQVMIEERQVENGIYYIDDVQVYTEKEAVETTYTNVYDSKGFEDATMSFGDWAGNNIVDGAGVDGSKAQVATGTSKYVAYQSTDRTYIMQAGEKYRVTASVRCDNGTSWWAFVDAAGKDASQWPAAGSFASTTEWAEYSFIAAPTETKAWQQLGFQVTAGDGSVYVDNFRIDLISEVNLTDYTEGIGDCGGTGYALAMDEMSQVSYPVTIKAGKEYYYSYCAKAVDDEAATVKAVVTNNTADKNAVSLTTDWKEFSGTFIATNDGDAFGFDKSGNGRVLIDDVVLYEKLPSNPKDHTYITGGGYNMPENAINLITNGNFENGSNGYNGNGFKTDSGMGIVTNEIENEKQNPHMNFPSVTVEAGHTYTFSFYLWICDAKNLQFDIFASGTATPGGKSWEDNGFSLWDNCSLDDESLNASITENTYGWRRVKVTWTASKDGNIIFGAKTYEGEASFYVDDVALWDNDIKEYVTQDITTELSVFEYYTGLESYLHLIPYNGDVVYENGTKDNRKRTEFQGDIIVNDKKYEATYVWHYQTILLNFVDSNFGKRMSETEVNTVKIPAGTKLVNKDTTGLKITNESIFYVQKQSDQWMLWTSKYDYGEAENANVQYQDMGAGVNTYTFTANTSANIQSAVVVTGPESVSLKSTEAAEKDGTVSGTVSKLGDYAVKKTTKNVFFDYTVALYKRGNVHLDGDGSVTSAKIDSRDLVALKKAVAGSLDGENLLSRTKAADANADGELSAEDATILRRAMAYNRDIMATTKGESLLGQGVMPIIGFDGPDNGNTERENLGGQKDMITEDIYDKIEDLGFNTVVSYRNNYDVDADWESIAKKNLTLAQQRGIKVYLQDGNLNNSSNRGDNQGNVTDEKVAQRTSLYDGFGSFAGYFIFDEPLLKSADGIVGAIDSTLENRPIVTDFKNAFTTIGKYANISGYMNLYPAASSSLKYTSGGSGYSYYENYVNTVSGVGADTLTYDMYLRPNGEGTKKDYNLKTKDFYENLDWMRTIAQSNNKPFQTFVQVGTDFKSNYTTKTKQEYLTTIQEMFLEASASLAMGSKGINYYSLIAPAYFVDNKKGTEVVDNYRAGLINVYGKANHGENNDNYDYYNAAKKINTFVAKVDHILMSAESKGVVTTDSDIQGYLDYTDTFTSYGVLSNASGSNAFVGCFDYYGKDAYLVVNTSTTDESTITLTFNDTVSYDYYDMNEQSGSETADAKTATIGAGDCMLIVMK